MMPRNSLLCLSGALLLCLGSVGMAGQGQPAAPAAAPAAADGDAGTKALIAAECTHCHELDVLTARPHTRAEWPGILDQMIANGAAISAEEKAQLVEYLGRTYSKE